MTSDTDTLRLGLENLLDDRDYLFRLLDTSDWDAQLDAVTAVLARNYATTERVSSDIDQLGERARTHTSPYHDRVVDEHVDAMYRSSYSDAAVSLSAIGMIVPMMESVLSQSFHSLGSMYVARQVAPPNHKRWRRAGPHPECWNCQWYFGHGEVRNDIISGLPQLSAAVGLSAYLEPDRPNRPEAAILANSRNSQRTSRLVPLGLQEHGDIFGGELEASAVGDALG